jgi:hypothetical protein
LTIKVVAGSRASVRQRTQGAILFPGKLTSESFQPQQHQSADQNSGEINHIERFDSALRQKSQLISQTLSFSKKIENYSK